MNIKKLLRNFVFKSLQVRIIIVIIICLFFPIIITLNYSYKNIQLILQEKTSRVVLDNLHQIGNKVESVCLDIRKILSILDSDSIIYSYLTMDENYLKSKTFISLKNLADLSNHDVFRMVKIENQMNYIKSSIFFNYNIQTILFGADGLVYSSLDNASDNFEFKCRYLDEIRKQEWYKQIYSGKESAEWTAPFIYNIEAMDKNSRFISVVKTIKRKYAGDRLGIIMINFREENFKAILGSDVNGIISLINENKKVIFSSNRIAEKLLTDINILSRIPEKGEGYFFADFDNQIYMVNYSMLDRFGWKLVSVIPYSDVLKEINSLKNKIYLINSVIFIVFLFLSTGLILYITNPLKKLIKNIREKKIGEYNIDMKPAESYDDVSGIVKSFDYLFNRISELVNQVLEEQKIEHELKYEALRSQINPHFLFNILSSIKWSAMMSGADHVARMISSLGKLLEISMNKGEEEIPFNQEIEHGNRMKQIFYKTEIEQQ